MKYQIGNIPIIFCSVHDGQMKLNIPIRKQKDITLKNDLYINNLCLKILDELEKKLDNKIYYIINTIHRKFLDLNRPLNKGAEHRLTKKLWKQFHSKLEEIIIDCKKKYNHCLILDFHGNNQTKNLLQFGYGISEKNIVKKNINDSSLKFLTKFHNPFDLIYLDKSFSYFLKNYNIFPNINNLNYKNIYYDGGYIIRHYAKKFSIDAIQLEFSKDIRRFFSKKDTVNFTNAIILFYFTNYYSVIKNINFKK